MDRQQIYTRLLLEYGDAQVVVAIEELSELQKELCKVLRHKHNRNNLIEEMADVEIMLEQMKMYFFIYEEEIEAIKKQKIERTKNRLLEVENES